MEELKKSADLALQKIKTEKEKSDLTSEQKKTLENNLNDAQSKWEAEIKELEKNAGTDESKKIEAGKWRNLFDESKKLYDIELQENQQEAQDQAQIEQNKDSEDANALAAEVWPQLWTYSIEELKSLTKKSWKDLWADVKYIKTIQQITIDTGAKHNSISNEIFTNGIYGRGTKAGIKTLQEYLNTKHNAKLIPDWLAGPATLQALLVIIDGDKTILDKIIADHSGVTPLEPEVIKATKRETRKTIDTKKSTKKTDKTPTDKLNNEPAIPLIPEEIANKDKEKKFQEKKKKILESIKKITGLEKSTDLKSLWITFNEKNETIFWQSWLTRVDENKQDDFTVKLKEEYKVKEWKIISIWIEKSQDWIYTENYTNKDKINNNLRIVSAKEINQNLKGYIDTITFEEPKYLNYYNKNIKSKNINCSYNTLQIWYMYTSLQPNDFLKKDNSINYKSLLEIIKTKIKENADLTEKKEEEKKTTEKYNKLKDYLMWTKTLTWSSFPKTFLYPDFDKLSSGQKNTINAFFEDFKWYIWGAKNKGITFKNPRQATDKKYIQLTIDEDWSDDKYWDIKISIQNNFNADWSIDKARIKQELRQLIDIKIKKAFPNYIPTTNNIPNNKKEEAKRKSIDTKKSTINTTKVKDDNINTKWA